VNRSVLEIQGESYEPGDKHAAAIGVVLQRYFGTPDDPHMKQPAEEPDADGNPELVDRLDKDHLERGAIAYRRRCAGCHGVSGDGNGPAAEYLDPKPRDYRKGLFKFASTPRGNKPTRSDLKRIIHRGAKGTSMPAFRWLPDEELNEIIDYVILLSARGELEISLLRDSFLEMEPEGDFEQEYTSKYVQEIFASWDNARNFVVMPATAQPLKTEETVLAGYRAFQTKGCSKCHGPDMAGGKALVLAQGGEPTFDDWGNEDYAADITSRMLHGGRRPIDIYRRIHLGINGTPMPGFAGSAFADDPNGMWHVVHFVTEVIDGRDVAEIAAAAGPIEEPATGDAPRK
jgi:mono/diheme cytochrome c family protein